MRAVHLCSSSGVRLDWIGLDWIGSSGRTAVRAVKHGARMKLAARCKLTNPCERARPVQNVARRDKPKRERFEVIAPANSADSRAARPAAPVGRVVALNTYRGT